MYWTEVSDFHLVCNFTSNLKTEKGPWGTSSWSHTDIGRLEQGLVGGQVSTNT